MKAVWRKRIVSPKFGRGESDMFLECPSKRIGIGESALEGNGFGRVVAILKKRLGSFYPRGLYPRGRRHANFGIEYPGKMPGTHSRMLSEIRNAMFQPGVGGYPALDLLQR